MLSPHRKSPKRSGIRHFIYLVILVMLIGFWVSGLLNFVDKIPLKNDTVNTPANVADAIIVLTGGSGRLDAGLTELSEKRGEKLFITGVYQGVDVRRLLELSQRNEAELQCCIVLDYLAGSTAGNAIETAKWVRSEGFKSIQLVTASYHMPRSLMEFGALMPDIKIYPNPVHPDKFIRERWWVWPGTANLIVSEYSKFLVAAARMKAQQLLSSKPPK